MGNIAMKEIMKETEDKMKKSTDRLAHEFTTIRAGRANPAVLDKVQVDYYGVSADGCSVCI